MQVDLIIHNIGQLITCASGGMAKRRDEMRDVGLIENGAIAVADGRFVGVGTTKDVLSEFAASDIVDAEKQVVCPGFVDPHTHIVYSGDRLDEFELKIKGADYLEILSSGGGIISTVQNTRGAEFEDLLELSLKRLDRMLSCGTTTCEIKTGYGLNTETELKMLSVIEELDKRHPIDIVPTFLAAHTIAPEYIADPDAYVELLCEEMLPRAWQWYQHSHFPSLGRPFFCDVFTEQSAFDLKRSRLVLEMARRHGFGIKAHVDQFTNLGGSDMGIEFGAVSIDHLDAISDNEIIRLAASGTVGVVIPTENFNAAKTRFANARKMIDAGCAIALSTDYNPGSAPCPSIPMAMAIACRYQRLLPGEALNAGTINAAYSIGIGESHGSIEVGKCADLAVFDAFDHRAIAYEFGAWNASMVFKSGRWV